MSQNLDLSEAVSGTSTPPALEADLGSRRAARVELYRRLGYTGPNADTGRVHPSRAQDLGVASNIDEGAALEGNEPPPLDETALSVLQERLRSEPEEVLRRARALWDAELSEDELSDAIQMAARFVAAPEFALKRLSAHETFDRATVTLPPEFFQDWPYDPTVPIDPSSTKFETKADAVNWVLFSGPALIGAQFAKKAPFQWHDGYPSNFVYEQPGPTADGPLSLGLVSDFGTGLYHSKYIAKALAARAYPYVVHGGDVYYAGRESEFATNFRPLIDPLLSRSQVFTMNANHEMYSLGKPYFAYINDRKRRHPTQLQEGSYFCLRLGSALQLVGIDTAYFRNGRYDESSLKRWLRRVLIEGRERGALNVLFSPNEPYSYGSTGLTALLEKDLEDVVLEQKLVDLWFWGNTHYCALFDRTASLPFVGSCIGHGGYPYGRMKAGKASAAPVRFLETGARFPAWTNVRQDRGNNGFCELTVHADRTVDLHYIDWMGRSRCTARISRSNGVARLVSVDGLDPSSGEPKSRVAVAVTTPAAIASPATAVAAPALARTSPGFLNLAASLAAVPNVSEDSFVPLAAGIVERRSGAKAATVEHRAGVKKRYVVAPPGAQRSAGPSVRSELKAINDSLASAILRSNDEAGRKVMLMSPLEAALVKERFGGLVVEEDLQYTLVRSPLLPHVMSPSVPASAGVLEVKVQSRGVPVPNARVVLYMDVQRRHGFEVRSDAQGRARVALPSSVSMFERVIVEPAFGYWSRVQNQVAAASPLVLEVDPLVLRGFDWGHVATAASGRGENFGGGVRIAIIDSGIAQHASLNVAGGRNFILGEPEDTGWADDTDGHGTHCAGVIAALERASSTWGYAPRAEIFALRVFGGADGGGYASDISDAIQWAVENQCDIISMSLGSEQPRAVMRSAIEAANDAGVLCVAATGNEGGPVCYPAKFRDVIGVSAIGRFDSYPADSMHVLAESQIRSSNNEYYLANFSNYGDNDVDFCAPGVAVTSTYPSDAFAAWDGTSMACPHVAGIAALILASQSLAGRQRDDARRDLLIDRLVAAAVDLGVGRIYSGAGLPLLNRVLP